MGVRTRPGIKHDHGHNQQREALAEQHRDGTGPVPSGGRTVLGLRQRHRPFPRDGTGHGLAPLPGWMLAFGQGQGLLFPPGCRILGPLRLTQPRCPGTVCPWCGGHAGLWCSAPWEHPKLWLFLFFLLFCSKLTPPGALEKARLCTGGCCPASPSAQGSEQRCCSGEGTVGRSQTSVPLPSQIPLLEPAIWGTGPHATLLSHPMGHRWGSREEGQRTGTAQCLVNT